MHQHFSVCYKKIYEAKLLRGLLVNGCLQILVYTLFYYIITNIPKDALFYRNFMQRTRINHIVKWYIKRLLVAITALFFTQD